MDRWPAFHPIAVNTVVVSFVASFDCAGLVLSPLLVLPHNSHMSSISFSTVHSRKLGLRNFNFPKVPPLAGAGFFKARVSGQDGLGIGGTGLIQIPRNPNPSGLISPKGNRRNTVANSFHLTR